MKYLLLIFLSFFSFKVFCQNDEIQIIRERYNNYKSEIKAQNEGTVPEDNFKIKLCENMPAIGPKVIKYEYYFSLEFDEKKQEYFHQMNFVSRFYSVLSIYFSYEEFLFDNNNKLIFYYKKYQNEIDTPVNREIFCYFKNEELLKIIVNNAEFNYNPEIESVYTQVYESNTTIPDYFEEDYNQILKKIENIKDIYNKFK